MYPQSVHNMLQVLNIQNIQRLHREVGSSLGVSYQLNVTHTSFNVEILSM